MDASILGILAPLLAGAAAFFIAWPIFAGAPTVAAAGYRAPFLEVRRREALHASRVFRLIAPWLPQLTPLFARLPLRGLEQKLEQAHRNAGAPLGLTGAELLAYTSLMGVALGAMIASSLLLTGCSSWAVGAVLAVPAGPLVALSAYRRTAKKRQLHVWRTLPYAYDLIAMTLRAGAPLLHALERVALDYRHDLVGQSFGHAVKELEMGTPRRRAFDRLAERVGLPEFDLFVDHLLRAEELGRPLAETVEHLSQRLRTQRVQSVTKRAGVASVMVMVPAAMILAANMIVLMGPFVVRIFTTMASGETR